MKLGGMVAKPAAKKVSPAPARSGPGSFGASGVGSGGGDGGGDVAEQMGVVPLGDDLGDVLGNVLGNAFDGRKGSGGGHKSSGVGRATMLGSAFDDIGVLEAGGGWGDDDWAEVNPREARNAHFTHPFRRFVFFFAHPCSLHWRVRRDEWLAGRSSHTPHPKNAQGPH